MQQEIAELKQADRSTVVRIEDVENRMLIVQDELDTRQTYLYRDRPSAELPTVKVAPAPAPLTARRATSEPFTYDHLDGYGRVVDGGGAVPEPVPTTVTDSPSTIVVATPSVPTATVRVSKIARRPTLSPKEQRKGAGIYKRARKLMKKGRYDKARAAFEKLADKYPTHQLADNALYWIGECFYAQKMYLEAIQVFQRVIRDYPDGNKVPDAMLKTGLCYHNLGEMAQARAVLYQVAEIYPGSGSARIALARVREIQ